MDNGGLIPACAGKTSMRITSEAVTGAHPRVCGENTRIVGASGMTSGSSPRVRGKRTFSPCKWG